METLEIIQDWELKIEYAARERMSSVNMMLNWIVFRQVYEAYVFV